MPEGSSDLIDKPTDTNRITLKILNDKYQDWVKAKIEYNEETGLVEVSITYSKYGINRITLDDMTELQLTNTNGIITANTEGAKLSPGDRKISIIDNNGTIKNTIVRVPFQYGREVLGYECDVYGINWRLFHEDGKNIYLIADDYIHYENLPTTTEERILVNQSNYQFDCMTNDGHYLDEYTGSAWIKENTNEQAQKWLNKYLNEYPESTNKNMKSVAYMMDTDSWSSFAGGKAEYAIGGPTIELFCASYKKTHPNKYIECDSVTENGYNIKWSNSSSYTNSITGLAKNYNGIYVKSDTTKANGMWIASPSSMGSNNYSYFYHTDSSGTIESDYTNYLYSGIRPIVCLKEGTHLVDNGDNTYSIKETIGAKAEYKIAEGIIEITVKYSENEIVKIEDENGNIINFTNENGIIKAITIPTSQGIHTFTITDIQGNKKKIGVRVVFPIYAKLYTDGTLAFTATDKVLNGKVLNKAYGNIAEKSIISTSDIPWYNQRTSVKTVDIVDKIYPISTINWFYDCTNLTNISNITNLDTSNVTYLNNMFYNCSSLTRLDLNSFNTSNAISMTNMFSNCRNLTKLDLSSFDTRNVTNMSGMFFRCSSLTEVDLSSFDTSNVTQMHSIFADCSSLTELNLSNFNTSKVILMSYMFQNCSKLTRLDLNNFNTSNVTQMNSMFIGCSGLTELDLSNFDTSNVIQMNYMFSRCNSLTNLNSSSFDTSSVTQMNYMFKDCSKLRIIYVGADWKLATNRTDMFSGCGTSTTTRK